MADLFKDWQAGWGKIGGGISDFWDKIHTVPGTDGQQKQGLGTFKNFGPNYIAPSTQRQNTAITSPSKNSTMTLNDFVKQNNGGRDMFGNGPEVFGQGRLGPPAEAAPSPNDSGVQLEGYLREIQDRLARSKATAPTINLDTKPIDSARESSVGALAQALETVLKATETARGNTNTAYGNAKEETQAGYDAIENRSRVEGKKAAQDSGKTVSDELAKSASVAMAGINQQSTDADALMKQASANLGGNNAALAEIQNKVDPNNSSDSVRNNISQSYQDRAGNAANQTGRDINASARYADTIGTDGASAIANLMSELAGRNNQYDRDIQSAQTSNAGNLASLESSYADKLMQAQLAQQQEQNRVDQSAWQTNTSNDSNALSGMLDLFGQENSARLKAEQDQGSQQAQSDRARNNQLEILLKGLVSNTDKNTLNPEDIQQLLAAIQ